MIHLYNKNKLAWRIRVTFADKLPPKEYITSDIRSNNPGWGDEVFNRTIERLEFFIPTGHRLVMSGMEKYNFFVEAMQDLGGGKRSNGKTKINAFFFCGKLPGQDIVEMWRIGDNTMVRDQKPWGNEWGGGPTRGWKRGTAGTPISGIVI
jgi:hypothetical protein